MSDSAPKRRWLRFRLVTVFLTTAFLAVLFGWLGREWKIVNQRQTLQRSIVERGGAVGSLATYDPRSEPIEIPLVRKWLGDETIPWIGLGFGSPQSEVESVRAVFPEADVGIFEQPRDSIPVYVHP